MTTKGSGQQALYSLSTATEIRGKFIIVFKLELEVLQIVSVSISTSVCVCVMILLVLLLYKVFK